jgi:hypothetical protein
VLHRRTRALGHTHARWGHRPPAPKGHKEIAQGKAKRRLGTPAELLCCISKNLNPPWGNGSAWRARQCVQLTRSRSGLRIWTRVRIRSTCDPESCSCSTTTECSTGASRLILGHGTRLGGFVDALGPPTRRAGNSSIGYTGLTFGSNERHQSNKHP